jgi:hypothetical protein
MISKDLGKILRDWAGATGAGKLDSFLSDYRLTHTSPAYGIPSRTRFTLMFQLIFKSTWMESIPATITTRTYQMLK